MRSAVFVSYSHQDKKWLDRLHVHLAPLVRDKKLEVWDDTRIQPGAVKHDELKKAIASAKVAALLVSADFLASDFIATDELPPLLAAARDDGAVILCVILKPCMFSDIEALARLQTVNDPLTPLTDMTEGQQETVFVRLTKQIEAALRAESPAPAPPPRAGKGAEGTHARRAPLDAASAKDLHVYADMFDIYIKKQQPILRASYVLIVFVSTVGLTLILSGFLLDLDKSSAINIMRLSTGVLCVGLSVLATSSVIKKVGVLASCESMKKTFERGCPEDEREKYVALAINFLQQRLNA